MNEHEYRYPIEVEVAMLNEFGVLKPFGYQQLFSSIAEQHLNRHHLNVDHTMTLGYSWVLVGLTIAIVLPITQPLRLYAQTWHAARQGIYFRREFIFKDEKGNVVFQGTSFSVLIHVATRQIFKEATLPFKTMIEPTPIFTVEASPRFQAILGLTPVGTVVMRPSFIDVLGHVNNLRYGEMAYDALTEIEVKKLKNLARIEINFSSELKKGDLITLQKGQVGNALYVRGYDDAKMKTSFDVRYTLK